LLREVDRRHGVSTPGAEFRGCSPSGSNLTLLTLLAFDCSELDGADQESLKGVKPRTG